MLRRLVDVIAHPAYLDHDDPTPWDVALIVFDPPVHRAAIRPMRVLDSDVVGEFPPSNPVALDDWNACLEGGP